MQIEIFIIAAIVMYIMSVNGYINFTQFVSDYELVFRKLKEEDYDFLIMARYGSDVNPNVLFAQRIKNSLIVIGSILILLINQMSLIIVVIAVAAGFGMYKLSYIQLQNHYKGHIAQIDSLLPYYLKNLEILIQHYTVPVAIGKSMADAPSIFRSGLQEMIDKINSGDDTIVPYMDFAKEYPVRDSMRMMRLLYRLSLGRQENKQEQLLMFSRSISSLQQKARETKYKNRLEKMEKKTMSMLLVTGLGMMVLLVFAVLKLMNL